MTAKNEVTAADIARVAGVGRAAVSNWRRRYPDFPAPVGGPPNSPMFDLAEVESWLVANGRLPLASADPGTRPSTRPTTDPAVATLAGSLAALLPTPLRGTLLDPACRDGTLLAAAARRLGPRPCYAGRDTDPAQLDLARAALAHAGAVRVDLALDPGDPPGSDELVARDADAVICAAPPPDRRVEELVWEFGQPARHDQALGWVQLCLAHLKPGGTAVVTVPFAVAVRASGRRIRAELLRAGVLTHVVALPETLGVGAPGSPWQVWVLSRPTGRPAYQLRMADLTDLDPGDLPADDQAWQKVFADPARSADVPAIELLDEDVILVPAAHLTPAVRDVRSEYATLRDRYAASVRRLPRTAPALTAARPRPVGRADGRRSTAGASGGDPVGGGLVSVGDLIRSGAVSIVDANGVCAGDVVVPAGTGGFEAIVLAEGAEPPGGAAPVTRPGSVLRCDPDALDPYFLACFLRSETNRRQAAGTMGGTFRLDVRRARVPRMTLSQQRNYGEAFRRLMEFAGRADEVAAAAADAARTAIYGLTGGTFAPIEDGK